MEDRDKIQAKIDELNNGLSAKPWDEVEGFSMLPKVLFDNSTKKYIIYADQGISLKIFINIESGETVTLWADKFLKMDKE